MKQPWLTAQPEVMMPPARPNSCAKYAPWRSSAPGVPDATGGGSGGGVAVSLESVMVAPCSRGEGGPAAPTQPEDTSVPPVQGHRDAGAGRSGGECAARAAPGAVRCARLCERAIGRAHV